VLTLFALSVLKGIIYGMNNKPPALVAINHYDYDDRCSVGRIADGRQFFVTWPFEPGLSGDDNREFLAVYLFDAEGRLLEAHIDDLGVRGSRDEERDQQLFERRVAELGWITYGQIKIQPFQIERFGVTFGLIPRPPDDEDPEGDWWVEVQPGNYMAFHEPWDSGVYDT
jgi:hypothetical protein